MMRWFVSLSCLLLFLCVGCDYTRISPPRVKDTNTSTDNSTIVPTGRLAWQKPDVVLNSLGDIEGKRIADIGAGAGYFTFRMVKRGAEVVALDVDERMLQLVELFKENLDSTSQTLITTKKVPEDDPMLGTAEFDIAVIINTVAFIDNRRDYLQKVKRGLKSDGLLMIVDFKSDIDIPTDILPEGSPLLAHKQLSNELERAGYNLIRVNETNLPYQYITYALP